MASHTEVAVANANGRAKSRKARTGRLGGASGKTGGAANRQPSGTDIVPVMKLRAIDIVDDDKAKSQSGKKSEATEAEQQSVIHMPAPEQTGENDAQGVEPEADGQDTSLIERLEGAKGEPLLSDPELLELLEQLSATIDTANTVLDAASSVPLEESETLAELANNGPQEAGGVRPSPAPQPETESEDNDLPPIAAQLANQGKTGGNKGVGFGLVANTALTGLVFAAGIAWVVHTNPWLVDSVTGKTAGEDISTPAPVVPVVKDQSSLAAKATSAEPESASAPAGASLASFTPPEEDPVPMETVPPAAPPATADAAEPARGPAGQPIDLDIALPGSPSDPEISVMVQGVPEHAKLSDGKDLGSGNWLLNANQLQGLKVVTQETLKPGAYPLEVILVQSDGSVPETRKVEITVEEPKAAGAPGAQSETPIASAPAGTEFVKNGVAIDVKGPTGEPAEPAPEPVAGPPLTPQELHALLTRGKTLLQEGDISGARLLLEYAAQRGSKEAMETLAKSYDPEHLDKLGVHGVQANQEQATHWYARAAQATSQ